MTVVLNEVALRALLESETGPVAQDLARRAERVVGEAEAGIGSIMARSPIRPQPGYAIRSDAGGLHAVIGIADEGSVARYLAGKAGRERESWLVPALRAFR